MIVIDCHFAHGHVNGGPVALLRTKFCLNFAKCEESQWLCIIDNSTRWLNRQKMVCIVKKVCPNSPIASLVVT